MEGNFLAINRERANLKPLQFKYFDKCSSLCARRLSHRTLLQSRGASQCHLESGRDQKWGKKQIGNPFLPQQKMLTNIILSLFHFLQNSWKKKNENQEAKYPCFSIFVQDKSCLLLFVFVCFPPTLFFFRQYFPGIKVGLFLKYVEKNVPEKIGALTKKSCYC